MAMTSAQLLQKTQFSQASVWQRARNRVSLGVWMVKILLTVSGFLLCLPCSHQCPPSTLWEEALV